MVEQYGRFDSRWSGCPKRAAHPHLNTFESRGANPKTRVYHVGPKTLLLCTNALDPPPGLSHHEIAPQRPRRRGRAGGESGNELHVPIATGIGELKFPPELDFDMTPRTYTHDIEVQFRDLDTRSHVNHVVYASYFERGKERLFEEVLDTSLSSAPTVVRALEVEYVAPIDPDTTVTVALGPIETGETSLTIEYELRSGNDVVATGRTVSVYLDGSQPASLPGAWRDALAPYGPKDADR